MYVTVVLTLVEKRHQACDLILLATWVERALDVGPSVRIRDSNVEFVAERGLGPVLFKSTPQLGYQNRGQKYAEVLLE